MATAKVTRLPATAEAGPPMVVATSATGVTARLAVAWLLPKMPADTAPVPVLRVALMLTGPTAGARKVMVDGKEAPVGIVPSAGYVTTPVAGS